MDFQQFIDTWRTNIRANAREEWPIMIAGAISWIIVFIATLPSLVDIVEKPGFAPTLDDMKELPGLSSAGSSTLAPITGSSGIQNALGRPVTVNQGDYIDAGLTKCTVGYIDHTANRIYLAGHCMSDNTYVARKDNIPLGRFVSPKRTDTLSKNVDVGYIEPHNHVTLGENIYSGDTVLTPDDVHVNDTLCSYGGRTREIICAPISNINSYAIYTKGTAEGGTADMQSGDSGGPAWIRNEDGSVRGFVGINSHTRGNPQTGESYKNGYAIFSNFQR